MSYEVCRYFGFYFEIDRKETTYGYEYRCENEHQFGTNKGYSFCPLCGSSVTQIEYENGWQYIKHWDVEELAGFDEGVILQTGEVSRESSKYFGINCRYEGVRKDTLNDDEIFIDMSSIDHKADLDSAMKNKDFKHIVKKLEDAFGDNFKLKYGIFTYIL